MIRLTCLNTLAAAFVLCGVASPGENLVKNPGFEVLMADGKQPEAWPVTKKEGVAFALDDKVFHSGARSARVEGLDPEKQDHYVQAWRQDVGPIPDAPLWVSAWVKCQDVTRGRIGVLHRDKDGQVVQNQIIAAFEGTFDWRELTGPLNRAPGVKSLQLMVGLQKSRGTMWVDDVSVATAADVSVEVGRARMTPTEPQPAGSTAPVRIELTLGRRGLADGGSVQMRWTAWRPAREFRLAELKAECAGKTAQFEVVIPPRKTTWPPDPQPIACVATLKRGSPLQDGDKVVLSGKLTYTAHDNVTCGLEVLLSPSVGSAVCPVSEPFRVSAKGGPAKGLWCTAEARPVAGQPGRVTVAVVDEHGNPAADFRGAVKLTCNTEAGLPSSYAFTQADAGSHEFQGRFPKDVVSRVTVTCEAMTAVSNPILPRSDGEPAIYFGDIHSHSMLSSDAVGDPDAAYEYARRFAGLDFAALSDHAPRAARWEAGVAAANRHNKAGRFVTFVAFESGDSPHGHRNIYYRDDTGPDLPLLKNYNEAWWQWLAERNVRALTLPHHPNTDSGVRLANGNLAWGPTDWSVRNDTYQRLVEICQTRGSFEAPGGPNPELRIRAKDCGASVQTALAKGFRLGFIGSTDTHSGRPGNPAHSARCAILARDFSRTGLWDALYARTCYATTGKHILVLFEVNGKPMGSEITLAARETKRQIRWRVVGVGPLKRVDLLRNNGVVKSWAGEGKDDVAGEFSLAEPLAAAEWWYLRVIQDDAEMAWSSPVWVDAPGGAK
ncbi:MAG: DUF3604 domain-containing protein [Planctomycetes bacterium]|nr:DUF3604 domain-containing protein [Planctomycetota bacterium]